VLGVCIDHDDFREVTVQIGQVLGDQYCRRVARAKGTWRTLTTLPETYRVDSRYSLYGRYAVNGSSFSATGIAVCLSA